jgi:hypothetical protein
VSPTANRIIILAAALIATLLPVLPGQELAGVYLHVAYRYGFGGAVYPTYKPHLFYRDGSVCDDLDSFLAPSESKRRKPPAWGRWVEQGQAIRITWDDPARKPEQWTKWFVARPAGAGMTLSGRYQSTSGGGNTALGGDVAVVAWRGFEFSSDGTAIVSGGAGVSAGGGGTGAAVTSRSERQLQRVRYRLDGHTLEIDAGASDIRKMWFYRYPDSDRVIGVGSSVYTLKR